MSEEKPDWAHKMAEAPFSSNRFTARFKENVLQRTGRKNRRSIPMLRNICVPLVIASLGIGLLFLSKVEILPWSESTTTGYSGTAVQNSYYENDRLLFTLNPEPNARAGEIAGYMIHFEEPLETFMGRTLTLRAVHLLTGAAEEVSSEVITKPSSGYSGLERYTVSFALPLEGMWELQVLLDDRPYGSVQLRIEEPSWDVSPEFRSGAYLMRGVEQKVGFIDAGFTANKPQKYMWHFWGDEDLLNGPFEVKAVKQGTDKIIDVYSSNPISSANALDGELNGADRHTITTMELPEAGRWRLLPYVKGRLLDTIVVEVTK
ncbi:uncharacterized protein DUF4871 [Paenibacillus cellulosilyticus]|uniref:Uncharacterized protein DUF4871 n=1 Tax=Paenibacillus cellulosilyticus TaxID=375489 RepID=A0A2V2YRX4_9BACL|nr:DUF4871 domain-containing protein [Paenibacillus cellulosilyticus]PWV99738.1 uncharacterized protein DUF4871 [Paenibacillus cellulosilyticus]QKS44833.1 DUF4871 domain-containing protein [Paenibacillus cellulosilyticus]